MSLIITNLTLISIHCLLSTFRAENKHNIRPKIMGTPVSYNFITTLVQEINWWPKVLSKMVNPTLYHNIDFNLPTSYRWLWISFCYCYQIQALAYKSKDYAQVIWTRLPNYFENAKISLKIQKLHTPTVTRHTVIKVDWL